MLDFSRTLGDVVKNARTAQGLTQVNVADRISIDSRTIIKIENYQGNPKMEVLYPLVRELKIDPWKIFYPELNSQSASFRQLQLLLKECGEEEIEALLPVCQAVLSVLKAKNGTAIE